jgi:hypothetical protein
MINNKDMKQQTAVQWLIEQFYNNEGMLTTKQLETALEREKEKIMTAFMKNLSIEYGVINAVQKAEQYYNETYGGKK